MSILTFKDLVNLKADEWNERVAIEYDISVEELKDIVIRRDLRLLENRIKHQVTKDEIEEMASDQKEIDLFNVDLFADGDNSVIYEPTVLDKFTVKISDTDDIVDSIALTGKIVVGADFSKSNLSDSYFCGCTFYQCNLRDVDFGNSVFVSCDFIACDMTSLDFTGSTISRSHIYESSLVGSHFDYVAMSDSMVVESNMDRSTSIQSRLMFTGFSDISMVSLDWKDSDIVQCTFTHCDLKDSDFKRVVMVDSMLIRSNLIGADLNSLSVTCISMSSCTYDEKYKSFFEMDHLLYSPAVFEWEDVDDYMDEEDDDEEDKIW